LFLQFGNLQLQHLQLNREPTSTSICKCGCYDSQMSTVK
jgi:hypothetical protein